MVFDSFRDFSYKSSFNLLIISSWKDYTYNLLKRIRPYSCLSPSQYICRKDGESVDYLFLHYGETAFCGPNC